MRRYQESRVEEHTNVHFRTVRLLQSLILE